MSETLVELRADYEDLRARWKNGEPWLKARTGDAYRAWFRQSVAEGIRPDALRKHSANEKERFFARVVPGPDGHSYWNGGALFLRNDGRRRNPQSWWWEHVHGQITDRSVVKPTCGEPHCITVEHQRLAPWSEIKMRFSESQCIGALQVAAMRLGHSPTRREYEKLGLRPSAHGLELRYSSWPRALKAAGLPAPKEADNQGRFTRLFSDAACFQAVRDFHDHHGFIPSGAHWERTGQRPSYNTVTRRFGGWRRFLRAAGLDK